MTMRVHNAEQFEELRQSSRGGGGSGFGSSPKRWSGRCCCLRRLSPPTSSIVLAFLTLVQCRSSAARSAGMALSSPLGSLLPSVPGSKTSAAELSRESQMVRRL